MNQISDQICSTKCQIHQTTGNLQTEGHGTAKGQPLVQLFWANSRMGLRCGQWFIKGWLLWTPNGKKTGTKKSVHSKDIWRRWKGQKLPSAALDTKMIMWWFLKIGSTPSYHPFIEFYRWTFHNKPASFWGTLSSRIWPSSGARRKGEEEMPSTGLLKNWTLHAFREWFPQKFTGENKHDT